MLCDQCCKLMNATTVWLENFKAKWKQDAEAPRVLVKARTTAWQDRQFSKHLFYCSMRVLKTASLHFDWQQLDITVRLLLSGVGGSWNTYFYRFTEVITLVGHYQLPGKVSKPGSWIKIINKNKTEHLSKDRELTKSSSSYGPRDHGWNC